MKKTTPIRILFFALICIVFLFVSCSSLKETSSKTYYISNDYFATASCTPMTTTTVSVGGRGVSQSPSYSISSRCMVSLYEYAANVHFYSDSNELLRVQSATKTGNILAGNPIQFSISVDSQTMNAVSFVKVSFTGKSHEKPGKNSYGHTICLINNNGSKPSFVRVRDGEALHSPTPPQKDNYLFEGWYSDEKLSLRYSFSEPVKKDLTLFAKYTLDAASIANKISTETMKGVVKIYNKNYTTSYSETTIQTKQGSGFCFFHQNGTGYVLTNYHVVEKISNYKNQAYTIEDYQGHKYTGYLYSNPQKMGDALSPDYDLACLYFFSSSSSNIEPLNLATSNPNPNEDVISIGAPEGQSNFFTFGRITTYRQANMQSDSSINVQFDVIEHDAYVNQGSSGGPLLNANLEVIGINFAGSKKDPYSMAKDYSLSIPIEKIQDFLKMYIYR